nr:MAG TPA: hypothetical protein [Caudoviricetes sp.]
MNSRSSTLYSLLLQLNNKLNHTILETKIRRYDFEAYF